MNTFVLKHVGTYVGCAFYSVQLDGESETEYEKFRAIHLDDMNPLATDIKSQLKAIKEYGAEDDDFRSEQVLGIPSRLLALPPKGASSLYRLYARRISPTVVILFGGGYKSKTARTAQDCPTVGPHFHIATGICIRINKELALTIHHKEKHLAINKNAEYAYEPRPEKNYGYNG